MFRRRQFNLPDRQHLWDDSSDDEEQIEKEVHHIEMIDLSRSPEPLASSVVHRIIPSAQSDELLSLPPPVSTVQSYISVPYRPRTIQDDSRRSSILPAFPTSFNSNNRAPLLLANVPVHKLNEEQLGRRKQGVYPPPYTMNENTFDVPSYFRTAYQAFISALIYQYNVGESILDYNLQRFSECFRTFADDFVQRHKYAAELFDLNEKQKTYAFEFYLQIDVDLFFMKTCSFRNAKPRSADEGLFCIDEPDIRYGFSPCNNCQLCVPLSDDSRRQHPSIQFGLPRKLRFLNGYETILNCPADCQTRNIIYAMTCPCGEFEYIGETSQRLGDRLWHHLEHFNRIIHEFLIGEETAKLNRGYEKDRETLVKDGMLLYKHAARCPLAMQVFLNCNPIYGRFVPVTIDQTAHHDRNYSLPASLVLFDSINPTWIGSKDRQAIAETTHTRSDEAARSFMRRIPTAPIGYTFSKVQRALQFQYFKSKLDIKTKQDDAIDLFSANIVAILPLDASEAVRRFVEALFITHTEAKLNTSGQLLQTEIQETRPQDRGEWCRNIVFSLLP